MANKKKRLERIAKKEAKELSIKTLFKQKKQSLKKGNQAIIASIISGTHQSDFEKGSIERKIFNSLDGLRRRHFSSYDILVKIFLHPQINFSKIQIYEQLIQAFSKLVVSRSYETWKLPKSKDDAVRFQSIFCHFLVKYSIPKSVKHEILKHTISVSPEIEDIIYTMAKGNGIHKAKYLPVQLNGKMNFHFHNAPVQFDIYHCLWYAKIKGMGISKSRSIELTRSIFKRYSGWSEKDDDLVFFLRRFPKMDIKIFRKIVKFAKEQFRGGVTIKIDQLKDEYYLPALFPNFKFKGRTEKSVLRHVHKWEAYLELAKTTGSIGQFKPSSIPNWNYEDKKLKVEFIQLRTLLELVKEGNKMKHCVGGYAYECGTGASSIWSVRAISKTGNTKRLLTIELIEAKKKIDQVYGKCNRHPTHQEKRIVKAWKEQFELKEED